MDDRDPNLEDQTLDQDRPGPGRSKAENLRRMKRQVRTQRERSDAADPKGHVPDRDEEE
jgi:hypothetical protein